MSGAATLLAVLSVVGYVLLKHVCHLSRYRWDSLEWQQNLFESTAAGLFCFSAFRFIAPTAKAALSFAGYDVELLSSGINSALPVGYAGSVIGASVLGLLASLVANQIWPLSASLALSTTRHGGSLRSLLHEAHLSRRAVLLTLESRKVYVGWVYQPPTLKASSYVVLFPTRSGARQADDLRIKWTTDYAPVYRELLKRRAEGPSSEASLEHFQLVIPLDTVVTATYFDKDLYERHFAPTDEAGSPTASAPRKT